MEKTALQQLESLAKGETVTTMTGSKVDMGNPIQVRQAQGAASQRASKIRAASPNTPMLPKSMKKKKEDDCEDMDTKKSTSALEALQELSKGEVRNPAALAAYIGREKYGKDRFNKMSHHKHKHSNKPGGGGRFQKLEHELEEKSVEAGDVEKSRFPGAPRSFSSSAQHRGFEKPTKRLSRRSFGASRKAGHYRNPLNRVHKGEEFDMEAFNRENPIFEGDSRAVSLKERDKRVSGPSSAKKLGADDQADVATRKMAQKKPNARVGGIKMASTAKKGYQVVPPGKARGSESPTPTIPRSKPKREDADTQAVRMKSCGCNAKLGKSLDPSMLPGIGSPARAKYEANYNSWKPRPKPAGYKPLSREEINDMNTFAAAGHKEAMHQLLDDAHYKAHADK